MAKCSVSMVQVKSGTPKIKTTVATKAVGPLDVFQIHIDEHSVCTVFGVDKGGNLLDISAIASLTPPPSSDNTTVLTVDPPVGMTFKLVSTLTVGTANVLTTATWNDGSIGPFQFSLPVQCLAGTPSGIIVQPGTPVPN